MEPKKPVEVLTFGCRLNAYESEVMRKHATEAGHANTIIVNTCAVTKEAERQAKQAIRRAKRENPDATIIVTGCAAQIAPDKYAGMKEVSQLIGNDLKLKPESWGLDKRDDTLLVNDIMSVKETASHLVEGFDGHARAFLQVQNGCDHRCTFCIIPFGRGNSRSVALGEIVEQSRLLVERGYNEIVLTGVDVTSYGKDLPGAPSLGQMMRRLLAMVPDLKRLRLSSLDPVEIDDDMWRLIADEPRLMPHLHLSVQAGDDLILKRMKRRHTQQDVIDVVTRAKALRPDMVFGADIIAGFPTEDTAMFENTRRLVVDADLTYLHVFPYSEREGTPAAKIPNQVPVPERKDRAGILRALGDARLDALRARVLGTVQSVVIEQNGIGRAENFIEIGVQTDAPIGSLANVKVIDHSHGRLQGTVINQ